MLRSDQVEGLRERVLRLARLDRADADDQLRVERDTRLFALRLHVEAGAPFVDRGEVEAIGEGHAAGFSRGRFVEAAGGIGLEDQRLGAGDRRLGALPQLRREHRPEGARGEALVDRPDVGDPETLRHLHSRKGENGRRVDERDVEVSFPTPARHLLESPTIGARVVGPGKAENVHRYFHRFEVASKWAVEGAENGEPPGLRSDQLREQVKQVELRAAQSELMRYDENTRLTFAGRRRSW